MNISELIPDSKNANKGTDKGRAMVKASIEEVGAARSVVIDKNNNIIGGNKTTQAAIDAGIVDVLIVETDGTQLVAVKRTDLDIDDAAARRLAYLDNRAGELGLSWDAAQILEDLDSGLDLSGIFDDDFIEQMPPQSVPDFDMLAADTQPTFEPPPKNCPHCGGAL